MIGLGLVLVLIVAATGVDGLVLYSRVSRVTIDFPATHEGQTWVMIGSDSRTALPPGPHLYGSPAQSPGAHADAVLVIHQSPAGTTILSVPRDILVSPEPGEISRLTLTFTQGPQQVVDGLCRSLHIPATHVAVITMNGFVSAVNDLGGIVINNPAPVRDFSSGLYLPEVGPVHLNGIQTLALVRSRFPQTFTAGSWVAAGTAAGDADRTRWIGLMFHALATKARSARTDPFTLQALAWDLTGSLTLDQRTSLSNLLSLNLAGVRIVDLPAEDLSANGVGAAPDAATYETLAAAGYTQSCQP